jgi:phage major head subunit gpT-like protein
MATLTPAAILDLTFKSLDTRFKQGYSAVTNLMSDRLAMQIASSGESVKYGWPDLLPAVREWTGPRVHHNLTARTQEIINKKWELTVDVERTKLEDQQVEMYGPMAEMLGREIAVFKDCRLTEVLEAGLTTTTFDSQFFFDTDHPKDVDGILSGTQSNKLTGTALTAANYQVALATGQNFVGRDGKPLGMFMDYNNTVLMVPPALGKTGRELLNGEFISVASGSTQSNVLMNSAQLMINPYLTSATAWYLFDVSRPVKPLIWQTRTAPEFVQRTQNTDPDVFEHDVYTYGARLRGDAGYGLYFMAIYAVA